MGRLSRWASRRYREIKVAAKVVGSACLNPAGLAFVALIASIAGAAVLTVMLFYAMLVLEGAEQWAAISNIAYGLLATVAMILLALGRAMVKGTIEAEFWKIKFKAVSGAHAPDKGEDDGSGTAGS